MSDCVDGCTLIVWYSMHVCKENHLTCPHLSRGFPGSTGVRRLEHAQYGPLDVECPHLLGFLRAKGRNLSPLKQEPQGVLLQRFSAESKTPDGPSTSQPVRDDCGATDCQGHINSSIGLNGFYGGAGGVQFRTVSAITKIGRLAFYWCCSQDRYIQVQVNTETRTC